MPASRGKCVCDGWSDGLHIESCPDSGSPSGFPIDHLSASQIRTFEHCGEKWRLKYVEKKREPGSSSRIRGTAVHVAVAGDLNSVIETKEHLAVEECESLASASVKAGFQSQVLLSDDEVGIGLAAVEGRTVDTAVSLSRLHRVEVAPSITPIAVEQRVTVKVGDLPPLVGIMDVVDSNHVIRDTKTRSMKMNQGDADKDLQPAQYHISHHAEYKKPPAGFVFDNLIKTRGGVKTPPKIEYQAVETTRTPEAIQAYLARVRNMVQATKAGIAVPIDPSNFLCSPKYCGFFGDACVYTRGMKK